MITVSVMVAVHGCALKFQPDQRDHGAGDDWRHQDVDPAGAVLVD
jgi:hypothetical protein